MGKIYVQPIQGAWQDDIGKKMHTETNVQIQTINDVTETMEEALKKVDRHRNDNLEYKSQVEELEDLQKRLEHAMRM